MSSFPNEYELIVDKTWVILFYAAKPFTIIFKFALDNFTVLSNQGTLEVSARRNWKDRVIMLLYVDEKERMKMIGFLGAKRESQLLPLVFADNIWILN